MRESLRDDVGADLAALTGTPVSDEVVAQFTRRAALVRAVQVCAALDRILALSVAHTRERTQFGRPLAKFQAVQNLVADIAAESALARAATDGALAEALRSDWSSPHLDFLVAVARSCVGHCCVGGGTQRLIRCTVRSAPRSNTDCTSSPCPRCPGVRSTARSRTGTTSSPTTAPRRARVGLLGVDHRHRQLIGSSSIRNVDHMTQPLSYGDHVVMSFVRLLREVS